MSNQEKNNPYEEHGCKNRSEYLQQLAEEHELSIEVVYAAADLLGPDEDFDGLVNALEDVSEEGFDFL